MCFNVDNGTLDNARLNKSFKKQCNKKTSKIFKNAKTKQNALQKKNKKNSTFSLFYFLPCVFFNFAFFLYTAYYYLT